MKPDKKDLTPYVLLGFFIGSVIGFFLTKLMEWL